MTTLIIILVLFLVCQVVEIIIDFDMIDDTLPTNFTHKVLRKINEWLSADETEKPSPSYH